MHADAEACREVLGERIGDAFCAFLSRTHEGTLRGSSTEHLRCVWDLFRHSQSPATVCRATSGRACGLAIGLLRRRLEAWAARQELPPWRAFVVDLKEPQREVQPARPKSGRGADALPAPPAYTELTSDESVAGADSGDDVSMESVSVSSTESEERAKASKLMGLPAPSSSRLFARNQERRVTPDGTTLRKRKFIAKFGAAQWANAVIARGSDLRVPKRMRMHSEEREARRRRLEAVLPHKPPATLAALPNNERSLLGVLPTCGLEGPGRGRGTAASLDEHLDSLFRITRESLARHCHGAKSAAASLTHLQLDRSGAEVTCRRAATTEPLLVGSVVTLARASLCSADRETVVGWGVVTHDGGRYVSVRVLQTFCGLEVAVAAVAVAAAVAAASVRPGCAPGPLHLAHGWAPAVSSGAVVCWQPAGSTCWTLSMSEGVVKAAAYQSRSDAMQAMGSGPAVVATSGRTVEHTGQRADECLSAAYEIMQNSHARVNIAAIPGATAAHVRALETLRSVPGCGMPVLSALFSRACGEDGRAYDVRSLFAAAGAPPDGTASCTGAQLREVAADGMVVDEAQRDGVAAALSQAVSAVRGPPGSGKTHVAVAVARVWMDTRFGPPPPSSSPARAPPSKLRRFRAPDLCTVDPAAVAKAVTAAACARTARTGGSACARCGEQGHTTEECGVPAARPELGDASLLRKGTEYALEADTEEPPIVLITSSDSALDVLTERLMQREKRVLRVGSRALRHELEKCQCSSLFPLVVRALDEGHPLRVRLTAAATHQARLCDKISRLLRKRSSCVPQTDTGSEILGLAARESPWVSTSLPLGSGIGVHSLHQCLAEYRASVEEVQAAQSNVVLHVAQRMRAVTMTAMGALLNAGALRRLKARCVVVEEASAIPESVLTAVIGLLGPSVEKLVLLADDLERPEERSELERTSVPEYWLAGGGPAVQLRTQHRMPPDLFSPLQEYYATKLSMELSDSQFTSFRRSRQWLLHDFDDASEATLAVLLCKYLIQQWVHPSRIAVLANRKHAECVQRSFPESDHAAAKLLTVATVDDFRGRESDYVIVSLAGSDGVMPVETLVQLMSRARAAVVVLLNRSRVQLHGKPWSEHVDREARCGVAQDKLSAWSARLRQYVWVAGASEIKSLLSFKWEAILAAVAASLSLCRCASGATPGRRHDRGR
eukprot:TRINITY_DN3599_c2_g2_i4.p1 TRINITY_DN3599_c2_g2~~TRINITY_DN3599_c2_g2_i4.p1  ORF type:complete len:1181 (+),score=274.48 TRINITY_DN3599_c2_g2_i4:1290-4832(+)